MKRLALCKFLIILGALAMGCGEIAESDPDAGIDASVAECGNGVVEDGEVCDDGGESATCNADCTPADCGDEVVNAAAGEDCDDGGESATCNADCTAAACGDGKVNAAAGERCDDGNEEEFDGCTGECQPPYWAPGIHQDLDPAQLLGWAPCYEDTYADSGTAIADVLEDCDGDHLLMACGLTNADELTLAAMAPREDVLTECGTDQECVRQANGVGWYFDDSYSWGFAPAGEEVYRSSCDYDTGDQTVPDLRLCWHTGGGSFNDGYRCGDNDLNGNPEWRRVIYHTGWILPAECGNEVVEPGEDCDEGGVETATCNDDCTLALCGDGKVNATAGEECDGTDDCSPGCEQRYWASGVQQAVSEDELVGWEPCHEDTYTSETDVADLLADCDKSNLLMACGPIGESTLVLAAMAPRDDVLYDCEQTADCTHEANGVGWYFSDSWSWGFVPEGAVPNRNSCDVANDMAPLRMCWHSSAGSLTPGFRCGDNSLNSNSAWRRVVYHAD